MPARLLGIAMIYGLCWAWSEKRKLFPWKVVIGATVMQFVFALILFGIPFHPLHPVPRQ
jgi:CNT family concentrative nucleoside transporter